MRPLEAFKQLTEALRLIPNDTQLPYYASCAINVAMGNAIATIEHAQKHPEPVVEALQALVDTVNATGGVTTGSNGRVMTIGDPEWLDLADAYVMACEALGVKPNEKKECQ